MKTEKWEDPGRGAQDDTSGSPLDRHALLDRYEIFAARQGGMGIVYFVEDVQTHYAYAAKTFQPPSSGTFTQQALQEFTEEIAIWLRIPPYKHIVQAHFTEIIDGQPYVFMDYIEGGDYGNLRECMGHLGTGQAIDLAYQVCLGLQFANHKTGVLHLDLKPENVLINKDMVAKITDFGLAKMMRWSSGLFPRQSAGSLPYMSPEQFRGDVVDERSDIFSFGVMLYEMLDGALPYPFETQGLTSQQWREQLKKFYSSIDFLDDHVPGPWREMDKTDLPDGIDYIVYGCLFPDRANRWINLLALRENLELLFHRFVPPNDDRSIPIDLHQKAMSLYSIGRISEALSVFNQALKESPKDASLWRDAALALLDAGMEDVGGRFLRTAKSLDPNIDINHSKLAEPHGGTQK